MTFLYIIRYSASTDGRSVISISYNPTTSLCLKKMFGDGYLSVSIKRVPTFETYSFASQPLYIIFTRSLCNAYCKMSNFFV